MKCIKLLDEILSNAIIEKVSNCSIKEKIKNGEIKNGTVPMKTLILADATTYYIITLPYYLDIRHKLLAKIFNLSNSKAKKLKLAKEVPEYYKTKLKSGYYHPKISPREHIYIHSETVRKILSEVNHIIIDEEDLINYQMRKYNENYLC